MGELILTPGTYPQNILLSLAYPPSLLLIPESGTVLTHVYVRNSSLLDTVTTNTWVMTGSVPFNASSSNFPESFGPTASGSYFKSGSGADSLDISGSTTVAAIFKRPVTGSNGIILFNMNAADNKGWLVYFMTSGQGWIDMYINTAAGPKIGRAPCPTGSVDGIVAWAGGWNNTTGLVYSLCNNNYAELAQVGGPLIDTTSQLAIGRATDGGTGIFSGSIAEIYVSTAVPTSASLVALYQAMSSSLSGAVP